MSYEARAATLVAVGGLGRVGAARASPHGRSPTVALTPLGTPGPNTEREPAGAW
jgi:hypothetical protein